MSACLMLVSDEIADDIFIASLHLCLIIDSAGSRHRQQLASHLASGNDD